MRIHCIWTGWETNRKYGSQGSERVGVASSRGCRDPKRDCWMAECQRMAVFSSSYQVSKTCAHQENRGQNCEEIWILCVLLYCCSLEVELLINSCIECLFLSYLGGVVSETYGNKSRQNVRFLQAGTVLDGDFYWCCSGRRRGKVFYFFN